MPQKSAGGFALETGVLLCAALSSLGTRGRYRGTELQLACRVCTLCALVGSRNVWWRGRQTASQKRRGVRCPRVHPIRGAVCG